MADGIWNLDGWDSLGDGMTVADDGGFVDIQQFQRELNTRKAMLLSQAQALVDQGIAACNRADTTASARIRDKIFAEWRNIQGQTPDGDGLVSTVWLNPLIVQAMIELNARHAGDIAGNAQFMKHSLDVIKAIPENLVIGLAKVTEVVTEAAAGIAGGIAAGTARGVLQGFISSPLGIAVLGVAGWLLWKNRKVILGR